MVQPPDLSNRVGDVLTLLAREEFAVLAEELGTPEERITYFWEECNRETDRLIHNRLLLRERRRVKKSKRAIDHRAMIEETALRLFDLILNAPPAISDDTKMLEYADVQRRVGECHCRALDRVADPEHRALIVVDQEATGLLPVRKFALNSWYAPP